MKRTELETFSALFEPKPGDGMDPEACTNCGARNLTDLGSRSEGHRDLGCTECHHRQEVILRGGRPVGLVMPGNTDENLGYRVGEPPVYGLPKKMPCGCQRNKPWVVLLGTGERTCRKHTLTFRLALHYVEV